MNITFEFACQDDCLDKMVPSDLRKLVCERDALKAENEKLKQHIADRVEDDRQRYLREAAARFKAGK